MRSTIALVALSPLLAARVTAQLPAPVQLPMPQEVLNTLDLRAGTIQELLLPQRGRQRFEVRVALGGELLTLALEPFSIRSADFKLLVTDATGTHQVPAPEDITYSGSVAGVAGTTVVASLSDGQLEAHIRMPAGNWCIQPLTSVLAIAPRNLHVVYKTKDVVQTAAMCGVVDQHDHDSPRRGVVSPAALQYCEIALDCDDAFYARNGSNANATALAALVLLSAVNAIYQVDVEIRHVVTAVVVRTVPTYTSGPNLGCGVSGLLQEFRSRWQANHTGIPRDTAHLLTGTGTFSGTVGCAFTGVICGSNAYGASRAISSNVALNIGLVAHEIGHNWNAGHCDAATPCNIMCASLGGCSGVVNSFGPSEVAQILAHKASRTCLAQPTRLDPNPAVWYRLNTRFQGPGLSLDVVNDGNNNRMIMAPSGAFLGQSWRFTPAPELPGTYRISSLWRGQNLPMDIINGGSDNNQPILAPIGAFTGQYWTLTDMPQYPGYVSLHTEFRGPHLTLEGAGGATANRPVLFTFVPATGQAWQLTPLSSIDPAAATSFGTACRGRGGVPALQMTGGSLPWINENLTGEVTNVPAGAATVLLIGARLPTPIDLVSLQSPGCLLRVNLDFQTMIAVAGGRATFTLPLPNSIPLVGATQPIQAAVVDPTHGVGNPLVAMTNGVDLRFGLR